MNVPAPESDLFWFFAVDQLYTVTMSDDELPDEPLEELSQDTVDVGEEAATRLAEHLHMMRAQTATFCILLEEEQYVVTVELVTERYPKE